MSEINVDNVDLGTKIVFPDETILTTHPAAVNNNTKAIRVANESCFDLLGVILAGSKQPLGDLIQQYVGDQGGVPEATILSSGIKTTLPNAALANGTMGHALDYDDFGGCGHPTVAIFPALLAIGEHLGSGGRDLLEAYVIGCELGLALQYTT